MSSALTMPKRAGSASTATVSDMGAHDTLPPTYQTPSMHHIASKPADNRVTLHPYRIEVDFARALPTQLLDTFLLRARDGPRSPNAKHIMQQRLTASLENESTSIPSSITTFLATSSRPAIGQDTQPAVAAPGRYDHWLPLQQPDFVRRAPIGDDISVDEEEALVNSQPGLDVPFSELAVEVCFRQSHVIAYVQSARDGAAIVRYLDEFYGTARGQPPTELECSHISVTCDV
ncbi:hypothetical protein HBI07_248470 [Parastagonospora nodorum]|nr:hypothetical protein HBI84_246650 [Parastagonospora nodorum]KAH6516767.1 hypothetical protein HBI07_248470 [Parastagonospora nodorum]